MSNSSQFMPATAAASRTPHFANRDINSVLLFALGVLCSLIPMINLLADTTFNPGHALLFTTGAITIVAAFAIHDRFSIWLLAFYLMWPIAGTMFLLSRPLYAYRQGSTFDLPIDALRDGLQIYFLYYIFLAVAIIITSIFSRLFPSHKNHFTCHNLDSEGDVIRSRIHQDILEFALCFLLIAIGVYASVVLWLGEVPILSGRAFVDELYDRQYGPFYRFRGAGTLAIGLLGFVVNLPQLRHRSLVALLIALLVVIVCLDGKRDIAMTGLLMALVLTAAVPGMHIRRELIALLFGGATLYIALLYIRAGRELQIEDMTELFSRFGGEFGDFVQFAYRFPPGSIQNYDWSVSAIGALLPEVVLELYGLDKTTLTMQGSAYALQEAVGAPFGVRVGLVGELWLAFGYVGLIVMFLYGILIATFTQFLARAKSPLGLTFVGFCVSLLASWIMNQNTVVTGAVFAVLYVLAAGCVVRKVTRWLGIMPPMLRGLLRSGTVERANVRPTRTASARSA